jgi:hypothetical protein
VEDPESATCWLVDVNDLESNEYIIQKKDTPGSPQRAGPKRSQCVLGETLTRKDGALFGLEVCIVERQFVWRPAEIKLLRTSELPLEYFQVPQRTVPVSRCT